jgi:hypothetical protein
MFASFFPPCINPALKTVNVMTGLAAAGLAWWAAHLWLEASKVTIEDVTAGQMTNSDDPALDVLANWVSVNATQSAYNRSAQLNARAARWTAWAAVLTGAAAFLSVL